MEVEVVWEVEVRKKERKEKEGKALKYVGRRLEAKSLDYVLSQASLAVLPVTDLQAVKG